MECLDYFRTMGRYNRWMNRKLYQVCEALPDAVRKQDRGAYFRSVHGTLNHLLLADRLQLARFAERPFAFESLDQELYADFETLRREREKTDAEILEWVESFTPEQLAAPFSFTSVVRRRRHGFPFWHLVMHFFNHQTHHRGQLTTLLTQCGCDPGETDLLWLPGAELD